MKEKKKNENKKKNLHFFWNMKKEKTEKSH